MMNDTTSRALVPGIPGLPEPLPSLPTAFSRRAAVFGAMLIGTASAGAGVAAVALPTITPAPEPLVTLRQRFVKLMALSRRQTDGEAADAAADAAMDLCVDGFELRATTPAGALASLEWAREEFARFHVDKADAVDVDWLDKWTLAMIDSCLGVLRATVTGGQA